MSKNPHQPVITDNSLQCKASDCCTQMFIGSSAIERGRAKYPDSPAAGWDHLWNSHKRQFEDDGAPDIAVEWELVASCSVCPDGGDMESNGDGVQCQKCFTSWSMDGDYGTIDADELEEIRDKDHETALEGLAK